MLTIDWSHSALADLDEIARFIGQHDKGAALTLQQRIEQSVLPAAEYPLIFRAGRVPGTREIVAHPNYIVVYRPLPNRIRVVAVLHSKQQYP